MKGHTQGIPPKNKQKDLITVCGDKKNEEVNDDIRISQLVTWRITETGKSEIKVIVYKDKFRFRCEKFEIKKGYVQVFMSTTKW